MKYFNCAADTCPSFTTNFAEVKKLTSWIRHVSIQGVKVK